MDLAWGAALGLGLYLMKERKVFQVAKKVLLTAVALVFISSCSTLTGEVRPGGYKIEWDKKTPAEVLEELRRDQEGILDLSAHFSISFDPPPEGQFSNLQGLLIFARGNQGPLLRIRALAPFGRLMFDLVQKGGVMEIYVPSQDTLYRGDIRGKGPGEHALGRDLTGMFEDFSGLKPADEAEFEFSDGFVFLPLTDGVLKFDRESGYLREVSRNGRKTLYSRYRDVSGPSPVPTHIRVIADGGSQVIDCSLSQVCLNCHPEHAFDLSNYAPGSIKDLQEIDR